MYEALWIAAAAASVAAAYLLARWEIRILHTGAGGK